MKGGGREGGRDKDARRWATRPIASCPSHPCGGVSHYCCDLVVGVVPVGMLMVMLLQLLVTPARRPDPVLGRRVPRPTVGIVGALEVEAGPMVGGATRTPSSIFKRMCGSMVNRDIK